MNNINNYFISIIILYILYKMDYLLILLILTIIIISFIILNKNKNKKYELFLPNRYEVPSINEWNMNAMAFLCRTNIDDIPDKYSFVKFCDRMNREKDYQKFINLIINQPTDYKTEVFNSSKFYYAPAIRKKWLKIKDKKALGNTLATFKNNPADCEKLANNIKFAVAFNYKKNGCDIKDKKILIDSKGTDVYLNEFTVQYSIGFWIQINSISNEDRTILSIKNPKDNEVNAPSITIIKNLTAIKITISTESNKGESLKISTGYVPFKKWVQITFTIQGKFVKAYVNSRLVDTEILEGYPIKNNSSSLLNITKWNGLSLSKLRIIPICVPKTFIKNILIYEDPIKNLNSSFHYTWDNQQSEYNQNGRNLQLLNTNQFPINPSLNINRRKDEYIDHNTVYLDEQYRRPSYRIVSGVVYLSGMVGSVNKVGLLLVLPLEARPDKTLYFNSGFGENHVRLTVKPNGYLEVGKNTPPNGLITLDTVRYPLNAGAPLDYHGPNLIFFVKIYKTGLIALSEVEIYDESGKNIAKRKRITASSTKSKTSPYNIIDGKKTKNIGGKWKYNKSMWVSEYKNGENFILINLNGGHIVDKVKLINTDIYNSSVSGLKISLLNAWKETVATKTWKPTEFLASNKISKTLSNKTCQNWYSDYPHKNKYAPPQEITGDFGEHITEYEEKIVEIPNDPDFEKSLKGDCKKGNRITKDKNCEDAAKYLNAEKGDFNINNDKLPFGCYYSNNDGKIYKNINNTGTDGGVSTIMKRQGRKYCAGPNWKSNYQNRDRGIISNQVNAINIIGEHVNNNKTYITYERKKNFSSSSDIFASPYKLFIKNAPNGLENGITNGNDWLGIYKLNELFDLGVEYIRGKETKTNKGKKCLPWKTAKGGKQSYFAKSDDDNACGDPDSSGFDWCYTSNGPRNYWGKCNKAKASPDERRLQNPIAYAYLTNDRSPCPGKKQCNPDGPGIPVGKNGNGEPIYIWNDKNARKFLDQLKKPGKYSIYYILGKRNNKRKVMPISRTDIIYNRISISECEKQCLKEENCKGIVTRDDGTCVKCTGDIQFKNDNKNKSSGSSKLKSENNLVCRIHNPPTIKKTYIPKKKFIPGFVNSYTLKDMFGNVISKKGKQRIDSKPFKMSCKPGFIKSYKFNDQKQDRVCYEKISKNNSNKNNKSCAGKKYLSENECKKVADELQKEFVVENNSKYPFPLGCKESPWNGKIYYSNVGGDVNNWSLDYNFYCKKDCSDQSDKNSIGKIQCSTNKFINKYYGGGKKVFLKKGQLLTEEDKKKTYFKPNKNWKFNDYRDKGIGNHNYCRQTPTPDSKKGNFDSTTKNDFPHALGLPTQDNGMTSDRNQKNYDGNKLGEKLWCYTTDKATKWEYCGKYDITNKINKIAPPRNINYKFYQPEKEFDFTISTIGGCGKRCPTHYIGYNNKGEFREASWTKTGNMVYISGFCKLDKYDKKTLLDKNGNKKIKIVKSKRKHIADRSYIAQLPKHVCPSKMKVFICNLDDGICRIQITKEGLIQLIDANNDSRGYKQNWISLDGISYCINEQTELKLSSKYESFDASKDKLLEFQSLILRKGPSIYFEEKYSKSKDYGSVKITDHGIGENKKSSKKGLISLSGIIILKSPFITNKVASINEEYRPNKTLNFFVVQNKNNSTSSMITINSRGEILLSADNKNNNNIKFISLDGISYFTNKSEQFLDDEINESESSEKNNFNLNDLNWNGKLKLSDKNNLKCE